MWLKTCRLSLGVVMAEILLPNGTKATGKTVVLKTQDGEQLTATDEFDLSQDGNSVSIFGTGQIIWDVLKGGRKLEDLTRAIVLSPTGAQIMQVVITSFVEMRSQQFMVEFEGYVDRSPVDTGI